VSGKDEQLDYPICPQCVEEGRSTYTWCIGYTSIYVTEEMNIDEIESITDYLYLDKEVNISPCGRTKEVFPTYLLIPTSSHQGVDGTRSANDMLHSLVESCNVIKCDNDHVVPPRTELFDKVIKAVIRYNHIGGAKWE
jgi:hypothetical protein